MRTVVLIIKFSAFLLISSGCSNPWLPERAELIFSSTRSGNAEVYVARGSDSAITNLTDQKDPDNWASWSPDGNYIAYQTRREGKFDVWLMNADGSNKKMLTSHPDHDYLPEWVPGGQQISFTSWRQEPGDTSRAPHVYIMNRDGSAQRRLVTEPLNTSAAASWSPDGKTFVVTKSINNRADLYLMNADGLEIKQLTNDTLYDGSPEFSPDGSRIAFYCSSDDRSDIVVINIDGADRQVITNGGLYWYPHWSPDGKWILSTMSVPGTEGRDLDLVALSVDGSGSPVVLRGGPGRDSEGRWKRTR